MIGTDFGFVLVWWMMLLVLGIINLPLTSLLFKKFPDKGYIFAKIMGILLISYFAWILASLKILPFGMETIILSLIFIIVINIIIVIKNQGLFKKLPLKFFLLEEGLFFVCLCFWAFVRGTNPEIRGLEKFMDFGFVNSILRSKYMPPFDMWLTPLTINYYYFGHFATAVLTKLSGFDSAITYNLMLASLFAFCFSGSFSLSFNLFAFFLSINKFKISWKYPIFSGVISAFLCSMAGNLHTIIYVIKNGVNKYWYPDATRYIPYTIHEFPIYSFVVSDLHGHVLDIPFVLFILSLIFSYLISESRLILLFLGLTLGVSYMTNAWDFPIYLMVFGITLLIKNQRNKKAILKTAEEIALVIFIALFSTLPFHLNFKQIAKGLALVFSHSPFYQLLVLWGFPLFMIFCFFIFLFGKNIKLRFFKEKLKNIPDNVYLSDKFVLVLIGVSFFLVILPEIIYVKDIYIKEYHRANTMFKFVYQSFMMLAIASGFIVTRIIYTRTRLAKVFFFVFSLFFTAVMIYPRFAINSYYNGLKEYKGLNGISYLNNLYPDDYRTILWIRENIGGSPVFLEAVGESYTDYARISANTGVPTVLGWPVHEWLWRGSYDEAGKRTGEVARMYESQNLNEVKILLEKYLVSYVVVGNPERQKYKNINEDNFGKLGKVVFRAGTTKVYKIN